MPDKYHLSSRGAFGRCRPRAAVIRTCGSPKAIAVKLTRITGNNGLTSLLLIMDVDIRQWDMPADLERPTCQSALQRLTRRKPMTSIRHQDSCQFLCSSRCAGRATFDLIWLPAAQLIYRDMAAPSAD